MIGECIQFKVSNYCTKNGTRSHNIHVRHSLSYIKGPFNLSGKWKGVMGDVVTGKYQMSINSYIWTTERNNVLEFVRPSRITTYVLCYIPKTSELDYGLVIRPFTINVWISIGIILISGLAFFFLPYFFISGWDFMSAKSLINLSLWFFFVFINAYYGGAMTMFFANEHSLPFENLGEVLKAFPRWNLIFPSGDEMFFKVRAEQVINKICIFVNTFLEGICM